jgi:CheY-like chemotaxis protein
LTDIARSGARVLVAIPRRSTRERVAGLIADLGYEVVGVSDHQHLADELGDLLLDDELAQPAAIIADPTIPGCSGVSLLGALRALGWDIPLVFVIDSNNPLALRQTWTPGVAGVFVEPFRDDELQSFIDLILDPEVSGAVRAARVSALPEKVAL